MDGLIEVGGTDYYVIDDLDALDPFLMNVVSDGDRWMFVSSTGALTAGRRDAAGALFPYETDDRLHHAAGIAGPVTRFRLDGMTPPECWSPFTGAPARGVRRRLAKSVLGDAIVFEERDERSQLSFTTSWNSTDRDGFVRTATLTNDGDASVHVDMIDGLVGIMPHGLEPITHQRRSNLSNAYKRSELTDSDARLAVFSLESPVSDKAEPEEVTRATVVWSTGPAGARIVLDPAAVGSFERGVDRHDRAPLVTGRAGAYLLDHTVSLAPGASLRWRIVIDGGLDQTDTVGLIDRLVNGADTIDVELDEAIADGSRRVERIMALADAQQCTADPIVTAHHVANVTYNVLRGGVPLNGYDIDRADLVSFLRVRNSDVARRHGAWLESLPEVVGRHELLERVDAIGDVHLGRLVGEYLPFSFSRRHGDPSRPWNAFSIRVVDDAGEPVVYFEGNWRDVFQNWEALCASFPEYLPGVVSVFLDSSTADGHNPYRVTRDGFDWEVLEPDDPWSNIGYWGDHQIIYLLRLLQATDRYFPGSIAARLDEPVFTYADVPYRIASYDDLVRDPKATIEFDDAAAERAAERVARIGGDGKLLVDAEGEIVTATMLEKFLVTVLAKLANFVPGGGIWMNTQRPEWNDANNALVGYGLSMVTLFHLRQFLDHLRTTVAAGPDDVAVSSDVAEWLAATVRTLSEHPIEPADEGRRRALLDHLGRLGAGYRESLYAHGRPGSTVRCRSAEVAAFCDLAIAHLDATIRVAERSDGLVHSYNLIDFGPDGTGAIVRHLPEMLEGQVAALGPGVLTPADQADLVDALATSALVRPDQQTFVLAPVIELPRFVDKNVIDPAAFAASPLLTALVDAADRRIVRVDVRGHHRFAAELVDARAVDAALDDIALDGAWTGLVEQERAAVHDVYEQVVGHRSFIGRSGSMYGYEGIGSIYWHMVTKLFLATQEAALHARAAGSDDVIVARLVAAYERIRAGLGFEKDAATFGAIPTDPYSHTPMHAGAQQPGMTGAVKEELLARPAELGVRVEGGELIIDPLFLRGGELLDSERTWLVDVGRGHLELSLEPGSFGLTVCQVPVVVEVTEGAPGAMIVRTDGTSERVEGTRLGPGPSAALFGRTGEIEHVRLQVRSNQSPLVIGVSDSPAP